MTEKTFLELKNLFYEEKRLKEENRFTGTWWRGQMQKYRPDLEDKVRANEKRLKEISEKLDVIRDFVRENV